MTAHAINLVPRDEHIFHDFSPRAALKAAPIPQARLRLHAAAIDRCYGAQSAEPATAPADNSIKRLGDFVIASLLLVAFSPIMALIAFLVRLDGGPVLFGHRRVGANGDVFRCWKFRTMVVNADDVLLRLLEVDHDMRAEWQRDFKLRLDPRVTRIGRVLRVMSLDELPQLLNVLKGDMSVVGPRPIVADEIRRYGAAFHDYARCRPGITGIWQVSGRNDVDYGARVQLDQEYARKWSLAHD
ncbi:MAG: sugar transferase, partial [Stellaceae bacterium]